MRKHVRQMMRYEAKREKMKPSRYVKAVFRELQRRRYGAEKVAQNKAIGTHPKKLWPSRIMGVN